jgi:hypothetical protein
MDSEVFECELVRKQLKKEELGLLGKSHGSTCDVSLMNDHSKMRYFEIILHPKSSPRLKLLEKMDLLKDCKEERLQAYLNKVIRNIVNGKLDLH